MTMNQDTLLAAGAAAVVFEAASAGAESASEAISHIKAYKFGDSRIPLTMVEKLVVQVADDPGARRVVAKLLADVLSSGATRDAKQFACRQLAVIGGRENVPAIAALLNDPATADMARYALEPIQDEAAERALIAALGIAPVEARVGIINSLGARRSEHAIRTLHQLIAGENAEEAAAARAALERIGTPRAERVLRRMA